MMKRSALMQVLLSKGDTSNPVVRVPGENLRNDLSQYLTQERINSAPSWPKSPTSEPSTKRGIYDLNLKATQINVPMKNLLNENDIEDSTDCNSSPRYYNNIKAYCLSDLHADSDSNFEWVRENCVRTENDINNHTYTIFCLPGDIGCEVKRIIEIFQFLVKQYDCVVFVPGNHEAWRKGSLAATSTAADGSIGVGYAIDTCAKIAEIIAAAQDCGVYTGPVRISLTRTRPAVLATTAVGEHISECDAMNIKCENTTTDTVGVDSNTSHNSTSIKVSKSTVQAAALPLNKTKEEYEIKSLCIYPLHSWYHAGWDTEPPLIHNKYIQSENSFPFQQKWGDFSMCTWPDSMLKFKKTSTITNNVAEDRVSTQNSVNNHTWICTDGTYDNTGSATHHDFTELAEACAGINEPFLPALGEKDRLPAQTTTTPHSSPESQHVSTLLNGTSIVTLPLQNIARECDTIISMSHFVPRQELLPEKRFIMEPLLARVVGSDALEAQIRRLMPNLHLFGHTHIPIDLSLEGVRYVQWPLGYSREARLQCNIIRAQGVLPCYDSNLIGDGILSIDSKGSWSDYYQHHRRDSHQVGPLAPWLLQRLAAFTSLPTSPAGMQSTTSPSPSPASPPSVSDSNTATSGWERHLHSDRFGHSNHGYTSPSSPALLKIRSPGYQEHR